MPVKYGVHETAALMLLMVERREVPNPELKNDYGIDLSPASRAKLNKAGLLSTGKEGRRLVHQITDAGITWCEDELAGVEPPARSGPLVRVIFEAFRRLVADCRQRGLRASEVIHPADLESLIRATYKRLSVKPQDWVRLAELRPKLNGAGKDEVDETLVTMTKTGLVHLAPDSDRRALTDDDRAAAIRIGREDKHLVAIEES